MTTTRPGERGHKGAGAQRVPGPKTGARERLVRRIGKPYRISPVVKTPEPASKTSAATDSSGTMGIPPVSGNSFDGAAVALVVALALGAEALADALDDELADGLAVALDEALDIAVAEALEAGLAIMLSSMPTLS